MSNPTYASISPASSASRPPNSEPVALRSWRALRATRDRERRLGNEVYWRRFTSLCRRELLRRDAAQDAGGD